MMTSERSGSDLLSVVNSTPHNGVRAESELPRPDRMSEAGSTRLAARTARAIESPIQPAPPMIPRVSVVIDESIRSRRHPPLQRLLTAALPFCAQFAAKSHKRRHP